MVFDPASTWALVESPEALEALRNAEADSDQLDAKYSDPSVLRREQEQLHQALYSRKIEWRPLTMEQQAENAQQFDSVYAPDINLILPSLTSIIRDNFSGSGDLDGSIYRALTDSDVPEENREDLADALADYINPRITSMRISENLNSDGGIQVREWMNASFINSFLWSNRHVDFNDAANSLNIWDSLESKVTPKEQEVDPLHDITPIQIEEIWAWYASGVDIVDAMIDILWANHEAVITAQNLDNPDSINDRRADMYEDLDVDSADRIDLTTGEGWDVFTNLISENYTRVFVEGSEDVDTKASLILASQISANKIIEGKHTFTRTVEFNDAYNRIQEWSQTPEDMKQDLMLIYTTVNNAEGIRWKSRQSEAYRTRKRAEQKALFLEAEFQNIQRLITTPQDQIDTRPKDDDTYAHQWESIPTSGEVFTAWALDLWSTQTEQMWENV